MTLKIGFTGTRKGMSPSQKAELRRVLSLRSEPGEFHHGDCMGSDEQAHELAKAYGWRIIVHPPSRDEWRAWCEGDINEIPKPYLTRDHDIVDAVDVLYAAPATDGETVRSGTWATVRYAMKKNKQVVVMRR